MVNRVSAEQRLSAIDLALPPPPTPFSAYVEAVKIGNVLQRWMYQRSGSKVTEVGASHAVFVSQPDAVARVIETAAKVDE
jgi:hypothetical protein